MSRPNLDHPEHGWIKWSGGSCPVHPESIVKLQFACGHISKETEAGKFIWSRRGWPHDVAAYRVIEEAAGENDGAWNAKSGGY